MQDDGMFLCAVGLQRAADTFACVYLWNTAHMWYTCFCVPVDYSVQAIHMLVYFVIVAYVNQA